MIGEGRLDGVARATLRVVPNSKDLFELFFMGPGLICILAVIILGISSLWKARHKQKTDPSTAVQIRQQADEALRFGRLEQATELSKKAVEAAHEHNDRDLMAVAHLTYGKVAARVGDDELAREQFDKARQFADQAVLAAFIWANLSLALGRLRKVPEALNLATQAVAAQAAITDPEARPGAGWAQVALAMAQTDSGQDGREAALRGLEIFRAIEAEQARPWGESSAFACYATAYAMRATRDSSAAWYAAEAVASFSRLHLDVPSLYARRLQDAKRLAEEIGQ
jgi:tetratricopeptide (TPR) repeat protein